MESEFIVLMISVPDIEVGRQIAHALVEEHLAACVNILPPMQAVYRWKGQVKSEQEHMLVIKTRRVLFEPALRNRIEELHPYQIPEIVALPITAGSRAYLNWLLDSTLMETV